MNPVKLSESTSWFRMSEDPTSFFHKVLFLEGFENSSNIYVLEDNNQLTLIDTGNDWTAFHELFEHYSVRDLKTIILTHGHSDHTMGLFELVRSYSDFNNFQIILHKAFSDNLREILKKFNKEFRIMPVLGGEKIRVSGLTLEVIHTPGHTIDSICLYHPESATLFSGDAVSFHPIVDEKMGGDMPSFVHSLRVLSKYEIKNILPGHTLPALFMGKGILNKAYRKAIMEFAPESGDLKETATNLIKVGLLDEAVMILDECIEVADEEDRARLIGLKASVLADMGRYEESIRLFDEIADKYPSALYSKGMVYMRLEDYKKALDCFNELLKIKPDDKKGKLAKGMALYKLGRVEEALSIDEFRLIYKVVEKN